MTSIKESKKANPTIYSQYNQKGASDEHIFEALSQHGNNTELAKTILDFFVKHNPSAKSVDPAEGIFLKSILIGSLS